MQQSRTEHVWYSMGKMLHVNGYSTEPFCTVMLVIYGPLLAWSSYHSITSMVQHSIIGLMYDIIHALVASIFSVAKKHTAPKQKYVASSIGKRP